MSFDTDSNLIFRGEIKRALGAVIEPEACSECVLFTMNESILNLIEKYDPIAVAERDNERKQSSMNSFLVNDFSKETISGKNGPSQTPQGHTNVPSRGRPHHVSFNSVATSGISRYTKFSSWFVCALL